MNALYKVTGLMIFGLSLMSCDALYIVTALQKSYVLDEYHKTI